MQVFDRQKTPILDQVTKMICRRDVLYFSLDPSLFPFYNSC